MSSGVSRVATGKYTGTGAALDIALPFAPKKIEIVNLTDGIIGIKTNMQPDGNHTQIAVDGAISQITSEGITIPEPVAVGLGDFGDIAKFSLGTNAGVNGADKDCMYTAFE